LDTSNPAGTAELIAQIIEEELAIEDKLNDEVRDILDQYSDYMRREGVSYAEMFRVLRASVSLLGDETREPLPLGPGPQALVTTGEAFTQVNLRQNLKLVEVALDLAAPVPGEEILDLCCGLGNLAVPAAARGGQVTGVDIDGEAVRQARENSGRLGFKATFVRDDAAAAARALAGAGRRFTLVLLNPPRTGAREAASIVPSLAPLRIVVVSCDPATLARDASVLAAAGYALEAVCPIDLFPQTAHVETVTLFRLKRAP
jgi:tRNA/tmRNA/rRNA uracil-C5-methylase (TrmA/RlmC/RlmD family)